MSTAERKENQRCCLGLLYYSQALEQEKKPPVCLGVPHTPVDAIHLDSRKQLSGTADFRFLCVGHSLYDRASTSQQESSQSDSSDSSSTTGAVGSRLPYCEGLEILVGSASDATASTAADSLGARQPDDLAAVMTSMLGGEQSPFVKGLVRFNNTASRNWERMKSTAGQAYSMTIKPLIDKLSGGQ